MIEPNNIRCRPYRGLGARLRMQTHGSGRGLIATAPAGAEMRPRGAAVLNSEASELEERIANNVAKLLER